jgi:ComF family protein
MQAVLRVLNEVLARVVAPAQCAACDVGVRHGRAFCAACAATLVRATNEDETHVAAFAYGGAIAQTIRRFKFDDRPDLARALLAGLATELPRLRAAHVDLAVPVPLHPTRLVERGYNQAALLAGPLAEWLGVPMRARALARPVATERQTELARGARAVNVEGAFVAREPRHLSGRTVLVVDDVETTGATLAACTQALILGGAHAVRTVVIARAEVKGDP